MPIVFDYMLLLLFVRDCATQLVKIHTQMQEMLKSMLCPKKKSSPEKGHIALLPLPQNIKERLQKFVLSFDFYQLLEARLISIRYVHHHLTFWCLP